MYFIDSKNHRKHTKKINETGQGKKVHDTDTMMDREKQFVKIKKKKGERKPQMRRENSEKRIKSWKREEKRERGIYRKEKKI